MSDVLVALRDASWWDHPNVRTPKRHHRSIGGVAACNRRLLLDPYSYTSTELVAASSLCGRCFRVRAGIADTETPHG